MPEFSGHVLIIEDEPLIALELEALLGDLGFQSFDIADCPRDALACVRTFRPVLITADYRIFRGTGVEAVELITQAVGEIPVIYVTGSPGQLPLHLGPIVDKPISQAALSAACAWAWACGPSHLDARRGG